MIDATVLIYMALAAVVSAWCYDHVGLRMKIREALNLSKKVNENAKEIAEEIQKAHNAQVSTLIEIGRKVEAISNKVELAQITKRSGFVSDLKPK